MSRKIPSSTKAKKVKLQAKRQRKRDGISGGDDALPTSKGKNKSLKHAKRNFGKSQIDDPNLISRQRARRALESRFVRLPKATMDYYVRENARKPLVRPIDQGFGKWKEDWTGDSVEGLSCPRRPKWNYEMSKKELEKNEEGQFRRWIHNMDNIISGPIMRYQDHEDEDLPPRAPTFFERNLEVWRQLWRVTEASEILLVLLDVRCPLLHLPNSLQEYIKGTKPKKKVVLVLTKCDLVPEAISTGWKDYFDEKYQVEGWRCVFLESYQTKSLGENTQANATTNESGISEVKRTALMREIQRVHEELIKPPKEILHDAVKVERWKPKVKVQVDWFGREGYHHLGHDDKEDIDIKEGSNVDVNEKSFLSIGLIGQPNVGKSSLLNSLVGRKVVKASKTPGKTKHFQTFFLNPTLRLVDCPGLVFPSMCAFELQVLGAIIPLQNIAPVMHFICERLPLEEILKLPIRKEVWTTDDVLASYAETQGFITAKAGRPDIYRSGHAILRAMHSGGIKWAFVPDTEHESGSTMESVGGREGIWLKDFQSENGIIEIQDEEGEEGEDEKEEDGLSEEDEEGEDDEDYSEMLDEGEEETESEGSTGIVRFGGTFAGLNVEGEESE